ncbi:MAG: DUF6512 family protein [Eubacteriales bacterium]|nr:DUF6512 family protein [Eubacteriales bacterium]
MDKKILFYCVTGCIFVSILGSLSHFFYEWSGENMLVAFVCPVNESTWEHMKLLYFPTILYSVYFAYQCREYGNVTAAMLLGNIMGVFAIPVLFYTYSGIYGRNVSWIDIAIFFVSVVLVFSLAYHWIVNPHEQKAQNCRGIRYWRVEKYQSLWIMISILLAVSFFIFTFYPPSWGLFQIPD